MAQDRQSWKEYGPDRRRSYVLLQFATQQFPPSKQSRLHGPLWQAQALRRRRDIHLVEIEKIQGVAILRRKSKNRSPERPIPVFYFPNSIVRARIFGFRYLVDGHDPRRDSTKFRPI